MFPDSSMPVVNFVDDPGFLVGTEAERRGTIRHGVRSLAAVYQATVPWCSILVRRVFGVAGKTVPRRLARLVHERLERRKRVAGRLRRRRRAPRVARPAHERVAPRGGFQKSGRLHAHAREDGVGDEVHLGEIRVCFFVYARSRFAFGTAS